MYFQCSPVICSEMSNTEVEMGDIAFRRPTNKEMQVAAIMTNFSFAMFVSSTCSSYCHGTHKLSSVPLVLQCLHECKTTLHYPMVVRIA